MLELSLNLLIPVFVVLCCIVFAVFNLIISLRLDFLLFSERYDKIFIFRKRFPYTVNCWFCNASTRVPYINLNSFNCSSCSQYNGFTTTGDYNRVIPEQHYSKLNLSRTNFCERTELQKLTHNGLCEGCNRNQEMKIIQLANFKPRCDSRYDEEVEEYRLKLEDSYQLCQQCNRHLKKTLNRVKTKLIGSKITQLGTKGVPTMKPVRTLKKDQQTLSTIVLISILLLSIMNLLKETNTDLKFLRTLTHDSLANAYYIVVALGLTIFDLFKNFCGHFNFVLPETDAISTAAVFLHATILFTRKPIRTQIMMSMFLWSLKMLIDELGSELPIKASNIPIVSGIVAGNIVLISMLMIYKSRDTKKSIDQNGSFHKIHSEIADDSDVENDVSSDMSNFDVLSTRSSIYPPASSFYQSSMRSQPVLRPAKTFSPMNSTYSLDNRSLLNSTFGRVETQSNRTMDLLSNRSFSIRHEVAAADRTQVHKDLKDINKLNISSMSTSTLKDVQNQNPFSLANSRCGSPTPSIASVFSGCNRTQIVTPPRLESHANCESQSWVAGGYWSSPQKRFLETSPRTPFCEISRSSSQSSGLGTIDSDKNYREEDVFSETLPSIFSEPVHRRNFFERPPDTRSLYSQSFSSGKSFIQPAKTNSFFQKSGPSSSFVKYRDSRSSFK